MRALLPGVSFAERARLLALLPPAPALGRDPDRVLRAKLGAVSVEDYVFSRRIGEPRVSQATLAEELGCTRETVSRLFPRRTRV